MISLRRKGFVIFAVTLFFGTASGCQLAAPADAVLMHAKTAFLSQQLIIKFKQAKVPCTSVGIADFASAVRVQLELVRPMSGDACVVRQLASTASEMNAGLVRMKQHSATEWVDVDALMKPL